MWIRRLAASAFVGFPLGHSSPQGPQDGGGVRQGDHAQLREGGCWFPRQVPGCRAAGESSSDCAAETCRASPSASKARGSAPSFSS